MDCPVRLRVRSSFLRRGFPRRLVPVTLDSERQVALKALVSRRMGVGENGYPRIQDKLGS